MIKRPEGSSATKNRYYSLYAKAEITAEEMNTLCRALDKKLSVEARDKMTRGAKVAEFFVRSVVAGLGGNRG